MGEIIIERLWTMNDGADHGWKQKRMICDVVQCYMDDIGVSDDPPIEMRTAVYLMSGRIRREADLVE